MTLDSVGKKLLWSTAVPGLLVASGGLVLLWRESQELIASPTPASEALARLFPLALWAVVATCGVIALGTIVSLHLTLTRPMKKLRAVMARAEAGDLLVRADVQGSDEVALLGRAFNSMLARLTSMKAEEIDTHRDLEAAHKELLLKAQLEHRLNALSLLYDVARSLTGTLEVPEVMERITRLLIDRVEMPRFSTMLATAEGTLEVHTAHPPNVGTEGMSFQIGEGACGRAAAQLRAVYLADVTSSQEIYTRRHFAGEQESGSLLSVPMVHNETLLGVLNFQRPETAAFNSEEIELLGAIADVAAISVKNALLHEETVRLSITDSLTGLLNRRALFQRLDQELSRAQRYGTSLSVVMIDIDHFKMLNDTSGHRAGDETLVTVAQTLQGLIRKADTLARYGGEEFLLILPQVDKKEAAEVAEKLRRAVEEMPSEYGERQPTGCITVSLGVSSFPDDARGIEAVVDGADAALYASKRAGRNKVSPFSPGMEHHPGRARGPHAEKRRKTGEVPAA